MSDAPIDPPRLVLPIDRVDPHSRRVRAMCETDATPPNEAQVLAARRAYYGAISYVDDQFGRLRERCRRPGWPTIRSS